MLKLSKPYRIIADCWLDITSKITTTASGTPWLVQCITQVTVFSGKDRVEHRQSKLEISGFTAELQKIRGAVRSLHLELKQVSVRKVQLTVRQQAPLLDRSGGIPDHRRLAPQP